MMKVTVMKRRGREIEAEVWGDDIAMSMPLSLFVEAIIQESGADRQSIERAAETVIGELKAQSIRHVK